MVDELRVTARLAIPMAELDWRATPSGGPGGQHANKASTRVEVRFDVASSPSLTDRQRALLLARLGPEVRVVCDEQRSQFRNRQIAARRLAERLSGALRVDPPRRATKPTRGSVDRRLQAKRKRADLKAGRRAPRPGEHDR
jgi:ribosome-associated protein